MIERKTPSAALVFGCPRFLAALTGERIIVSIIPHYSYRVCRYPVVLEKLTVT